MPTTNHLLPNNATPWEKVVSLTSAARRGLPVDIIAWIDDPWKAPADALPWLAWAYSVDIWHADWTEEKKRKVIFDSFALHRLKGTIEGFRRHVALEDAMLRSYVRPPARGFRRPAVTDEQRQVWLDQLPQIRIYPFRQKALEPGIHYHAAGRMFRGTGFRQASLGSKYLGFRATIEYDGVEHPVRLDQLGAYVRLSFVIGESGASFRDHHFRNHGWRQLTTASFGVVTIRIDGQSLTRSAVTGLQPVDVQPIRVNEIHTTEPFRSFHNHHFRNHGWRLLTNAEDYIYDRISLYDPKNVPKGLSARWFRGHKRYGIQPFTGILRVEVPLQQPRIKGFGGYRSGFRIPTDMSQLNRVLDAVVVSKSYRDKILVDTRMHRVVQLGDRPRLGTFKLGEIRRIT